MLTLRGVWGGGARCDKPNFTYARALPAAFLPPSLLLSGCHFSQEASRLARFDALISYLVALVSLYMCVFCRLGERMHPS